MAAAEIAPPAPPSPSKERPMTSLPQLPPPISTNQDTNHIAPLNDELAAPDGAAADGLKAEAEGAIAGLKREAEGPMIPGMIRPSKKPRDNRLRDCFTISPNEGGGEKISCRHCPDYNKTLQKFNPTKAREHLTLQCPGVSDELKTILLNSTQAARRSLNEVDEAAVAAAVSAPTAAVGAPLTSASSRHKKIKGRNRSSPAYISFHTDDTSLDVTAPIENGELILRLAFPTNQLKLNFDAQKNTEGAALCIDGFMNMRADASWTASMCSMTSEGTRAGPHCQWSLNPNASGAFEGGVTRVQKVRQLLKAMMMN